MGEGENYVEFKSCCMVFITKKTWTYDGGRSAGPFFFNIEYFST